MSDRQTRGQRIADMSGAIRHSSKGVGWFRVRSSTGRRWYDVNVAEGYCNCEDASGHFTKCKHRYAAEQFAQRVPRPKHLRPPGFAAIEQEVGELVKLVEADLGVSLGRTRNWRDHEETDGAIDFLQDEWRSLKRHMREFRQTLTASEKEAAAANYALHIIARHVCARDMMEQVAQMALDGCSKEQIKQFAETGRS